MKKIEAIKNNIKQSRYASLIMSIAIGVYMYLFDEFLFFNFSIIGGIFLIGLILNNYISEKNEGHIAIFQMILIIMMIGSYDFLSGTNERLSNFLNFVLPIFVLATLYGFYLKYYKK